MSLEATQTSKLSVFAPPVAPRAELGVDRYLSQAGMFVLALLRRPGLESSTKEDKITALRSLAAGTAEATSLVARRLGLDGESQRAYIEARISEWVAVKWVTRGDSSINEELSLVLDVLSSKEFFGQTKPEAGEDQMRVASFRGEAIEALQVVLSEVMCSFDEAEVSRVFERLQGELFGRVLVGDGFAADAALRMVPLAKVMSTCIALEAMSGVPDIEKIVARWRGACGVLDSIVDAQWQKAAKMALQTRKGVGYDLGSRLA